MAVMGQDGLVARRWLGLIGLSLMALPALGAGDAPAQRTELAPSEISDIESSVSSGQAGSKGGLAGDEKRSVIENVKVDKSAQPSGDSQMDRGADAVGREMMFRQPDCVIARLVHDFHPLEGPLIHGCKGNTPPRPTKKLQYAKFHNTHS